MAAPTAHPLAPIGTAVAQVAAELAAAARAGNRATVAGLTLGLTEAHATLLDTIAERDEEIAFLHALLGAHGIPVPPDLAVARRPVDGGD
jgi:hypothetical protein